MKQQTKLTNTGISPVVGVSLMVAITVVLIGAVIFGVVLLTASGLGLGEHLSEILLAYVVVQIALLAANLYIAKTADPSKYISFTQETTTANTENVETATINFEIPSSLNIELEEPYIIAPGHADPRDWANVTALKNESEVSFVLNRSILPDAQNVDNMYLPDKPYGPLNTQYNQNEIKELVYDTEFNPVKRFTID